MVDRLLHAGQQGLWRRRSSQITAWRCDLGRPDLWVAVNLSARQLTDRRCVDAVRAAVESDRPNESIDSLRGLCGPTLVTES